MKQPTIAALMLGLLIAMMPTALAFHPVNKLPAYGETTKTTVIKGGKSQYWTARADVQYRPSYYGTKFGGQSLRATITFERTPVGYRKIVQKSLREQQGKTAIPTVTRVSGMPGEPQSTTT